MRAGNFNDPAGVRAAEVETRETEGSGGGKRKESRKRRG